VMAISPCSCRSSKLPEGAAEAAEAAVAEAAVAEAAVAEAAVASEAAAAEVAQATEVAAAAAACRGDVAPSVRLERFPIYVDRRGSSWPDRPLPFGCW
jgi:hypothetical protein